MPIDHFLRSLAEEETENAIGMILSATVQTARRIAGGEGGGGITFAQDKKSAKYPAMPASAGATGCVDFVMPPKKWRRNSRTSAAG